MVKNNLQRTENFPQKVRRDWNRWFRLHIVLPHIVSCEVFAVGILVVRMRIRNVGKFTHKNLVAP